MYRIVRRFCSDALARAEAASPSIKLYNEALRAAGSYQSMTGIVESMRGRGAYPNAASYEILATKALEEEKFADVRSAYAAFETSGITPTPQLLSSVLQAQAQDGSWKEAMTTMTSMTRLQPESVCPAVYYSIITSCAKDDAVTVLEDMWERVFESLDEEDPVDLVALEETMKAYSRTKRAHEATVLMQGVEQQDPAAVNPSIVALYITCFDPSTILPSSVVELYEAFEADLSTDIQDTAILEAFSELLAHSVEEHTNDTAGLALLDTLVSAAPQSEIVRRNAMLTALSYNKKSRVFDLLPEHASILLTQTVLKACAAYNMADKAIELLQDIDTFDSTCYSLALATCFDSRRWEQVARIALDVRKHCDGFLPSMELYGYVIQACLRMKQFDDVIGLFEELQKAGFSPDVAIYHAYVEACNHRSNDATESMHKSFFFHHSQR